MTPLTDLPLRYRPDIDGLRAMAILGVLIYHLDPQMLPGGFVGVDVFFVISGFLISALIDRDLKSGTFSIARFYERRIRRIIPALFAMICAVLAASWILLLPADLVALGKSVRYAVMALPNIHFQRITDDYFNESVSQVPLLHTWSLGVEEQFYLAFPLLLWAFYRCIKSRTTRLIPLSLIFLASLAASARMVPLDPTRAFYLLPFRAWEMLLGTLLALGGLPALRGWMQNVAGVAGMGLIVGSMLFFDGSIPFPGLSALLPCSGAALLIWSGIQSGAWTCRFLTLKPMVFVGLISYSLYLWHWPLIALVKYSSAYSGIAVPGVFAVSLALGYLSWRWIERPFRNPQLGSRARVFALWGTASIVLLGSDFWIGRNEGFASRFSPQVVRLLSFKEKPPYWTESRTDRSPHNVRVFGASGVAPTFALWGDSHGTALLPGLEAAARAEGKSFRKYGLGALAPIAGVVQASDRDALANLEYSQAVLDQLLADQSIRTVILHARWSLYNKGQNELGKTQGAPLRGQSSATPEALESFYAARIRETVDKLLAAGKRVVLIYPIPEIGLNVPDYLAKRALAGEPVVSTLPDDSFGIRGDSVLKLLDSLGPDERIVRVRPHEKLIRDGRVTVLVDGQSLFMDDDHLSTAGALYLKDTLSGIFRETM